MYCPKCNEYGMDGNYCMNCGGKTVFSKVLCIHCKAPNYRTARFCEHCGRPMQMESEKGEEVKE